MESQVSHSYDASLVLKAPGTAAVVADGTTTLVGIDRITHGRGDVNGRYGEASFDVVFYISALHFTDETYVLNFNTYDAAGANPTVQDTVTVTTADIGKLKTFKFSTKTMGEVDIDAAKFGIAVDVGGTAPSITFWAFVAPNQRF